MKNKPVLGEALSENITLKQMIKEIAACFEQQNTDPDRLLKSLTGKSFSTTNHQRKTQLRM